ncbi:MAG: hypothetical protein DLM64_08900 [Solirubrobacterales bacterium]|nr:MAG: hypothetical protein DLM64_08900 [Solirubrobacterales bacterium]
MITLALNDGARRDVLQGITHGFKGDIIDLYNTPLWELKCQELGKLKVSAKDPRSFAPRVVSLAPEVLTRSAGTRSGTRFGTTRNQLRWTDRSRTPLFLLEVERLWTFHTLGLVRENQRQLRRKQRRLSREFSNAISKARRYQCAMGEEGATYRTVARRFQVTREEVCQYMALLNRLPSD